MKLRLGVLTSHPIQYQAPLFRELARRFDLRVFFAHRQTAADQARADFGVDFEWDVDLLSGYEHSFLKNRARHPDVSRFSGCDSPGIASEIEKRHFDAFLVTGWYLKCHWQTVRACRRLSVPILVRGDSQLATPRSAFRRLAGEVVHRWIIRQFDAFLYVGQRNREYLEHFGAASHQLFFSPHCVDNLWFRERVERARSDSLQLRALLGCRAGRGLLLFVGKFTQKKRPLDLLEASARLLERGKAVQIALVGAGALEPEIRRRAAEAGLEMTLAGFRNQSELPAFYGAADLLVLPSDGGETWGLVVNEAMACGTPAIVSDAVGCAPDLCAEEGVGASFPCGDTPTLARTIERALQPGWLGHVRLRKTIDRYSIGAAADGIGNAVESVQRRRA